LISDCGKLSAERKLDDLERKISELDAKNKKLVLGTNTNFDTITRKTQEYTLDTTQNKIDIKSLKREISELKREFQSFNREISELKREIQTMNQTFRTNSRPSDKITKIERDQERIIKALRDKQILRGF